MNKFLFISLILLSACADTSEETSAIDIPSVSQKSVSVAPPSNASNSYDPFTDVEMTRHNLSITGIGELSPWKDDGMGGYMSITDYHLLSNGNNIAYYLTGSGPYNISRIDLVLNINGEGKPEALKEFADAVRRTYDLLNMPENPALVQAAHSGQQKKATKSKYTEAVSLDRSNIETWKFSLTAI